MKTHPITVTFGALPIFVCDALIVPLFPGSLTNTALRAMLGKDADPLQQAMLGNTVAHIRSVEETSNCGIVIGVHCRQSSDITAALMLAERLHCQHVVLAAFGVYELTLEALTLYASGDGSDAAALEAHSMFEHTLRDLPKALSMVRAPLTEFFAQLGYVQHLDLVTGVVPHSVITSSFATLN